MSWPNRITEFQVAESTDPKVVGAIALQITERQGRLHSEAFTDFALADTLRPLLWDRFQAIAKRFTTACFASGLRQQAPFWSHCGLAKADSEAMDKLPAVWRPLAASWLTLKLKEDVEEVISMDKEFALFMESERKRTERAFQQAQ